MIKNTFLLLLLLVVSGCLRNSVSPYRLKDNVIPAEKFSKAYEEGQSDKFTIYDYSEYAQQQAARNSASNARAQLKPASLHQVSQPVSVFDAQLQQQGFQLKGTVAAPKTMHIPPPNPNGPPPGSASPYLYEAMTANPSLYREERDGSSLFRDFRAHQTMDIISIVVDENSTGTSEADTEATSEFDLLAGITEFFGIETSKWAANNTSLDPTQLINASSNVEFEGEGETTRTGSLRSDISAVIMEVLPNNLLRVEGTKIISINDEEEVMVISGLVRQRDINSNNQVRSSRIANMRIDFYGRGVVADQQKGGWGMKIFQAIWPF